MKKAKSMIDLARTYWKSVTGDEQQASFKVRKLALLLLNVRNEGYEEGKKEQNKRWNEASKSVRQSMENIHNKVKEVKNKVKQKEYNV